MKREDALKALDLAVGTRIDHMYQILADSYAGSPNAKATGQKNCSNGLSESVEAAEFMAGQIREKFKE